MNGWLSKLKGIAVLGALGGAFGAVVGGVWAAISGLFAGGIVPFTIVNAAVVYGLFGAFSATGLSVFLANARSKRSIEDVSVGSSALAGALAGAVFPVVFNIVMTGSLLPLQLLDQFAPIMATLGLFGGALTSGMVASAKRAHRLELAVADEPELLGE